MKIRNGFVSNSSSSSFIINGKINKVAKSMLKTVVDDFSDWGDKKASKKELSEFKKWQSNLDKALKNKSVQSGKVGITMPSCNYETYILQVGDQVHVQTARNHTWDLDYSQHGGGADEGQDDIVYKTIKSALYFNVKNKLIHTVEEYEDFNKQSECPTCRKNREYAFSARVKCEGKILCSTCYEEIKSK